MYLLSLSWGTVVTHRILACRFLCLAMEEDEELTAVSRLPPCLPIAAEPGAHRAPPFTESTRVAR